MQRHRQALHFCAVLHALGPQFRPQLSLHLLEVVLAPEVDALRGLDLALSHSQIQQLRLRSQTVSQRVSLGTGTGTGPCF